MGTFRCLVLAKIISGTLVDLQLDTQNSYLFIHNIYIYISVSKRSSSLSDT